MLGLIYNKLRASRIKRGEKSFNPVKRDSFF